MGYKVKWVEDNLGVTRKALRGFEKAWLMPENRDRKYRDYDDDDIYSFETKTIPIDTRLIEKAINSLIK